MSTMQQLPKGKPGGQKPAIRRSMLGRFRLTPLIMVAVLATISVKANHLLQGLSVSFGRASEAQAANNQAGNNPANTGQTGTNQPAANQAGQQPANAAGAPTQLGNTPAPAAPSAQQPTTQQPAAQPPSQQTAQVQPPPPANPATNQPASTPPAGTQPGTATTGTTPDAGSGDGQGQDLLAQDQQRKLARDPFNYTDEEVDVLQQLAKRRAELDLRARQLDEREALVKAAEQRMEQKMAELKALQATVQDLLKQRNAADEQQLQSLVKIYENMKPKAAAQIFEEMDMDVLLDVVARMNERKVAPILALVSPTRAKELTFELAQRRQMPIPQ
jgi:flagellar motility protein MotE (MotC chaperone)